MIFLNGVSIRGSASKPVRFVPTSESFGGVFVANHSGNTSDISHVRISGTTGISDGPYVYDAGLTLYGGVFDIRNLSVSDADVEDMVHIMKATADIKGMMLQVGRSDGLDIDYGQVSLSDSEFHHLGGDGVDTSKTRILMHGVKVNDAHDKGISLGEASTAEGSDIEVAGASACIVAKDSSWGRLQDVRLSLCTNYDVMAYIKKDKFAGATLSIQSMETDRPSLRYFLADSSSMQINNSSKLPNGTRKQVKDFYSTGFMVK